MRSKIRFNDQIMAESLRRTDAQTTRAAVEEGLRTQIRIRRQSGIRRLRGTVKWTGDLDAMRTDEPRER